MRQERNNPIQVPMPPSLAYEQTELRHVDSARYSHPQLVKHKKRSVLKNVSSIGSGLSCLFLPHSITLICPNFLIVLYIPHTVYHRI